MFWIWEPENGSQIHMELPLKGQQFQKTRIKFQTFSKWKKKMEHFLYIEPVSFKWTK